MSNITVYHDNALKGSTVTATNLDSSSSPAYLYDDRLSFKYTTTAYNTRISVTQPSNDSRSYRYLVLADHNATGTAVFTSGSVLFSGSVNGDPAVIDLGTTTSGQSFTIDVFQNSTTSTLSIGEIGVMSRFTSTQAPAPGIATERVPRRTFIELPNGERQSIQHGGVSRIKTYGLTAKLGDLDEWVDLFNENEGVELVILTDDDGDTYPCLFNQTFGINKSKGVVSATLEFQEVRLT